MNIITTDNSLAYTISDNTSGSGKLKRVGKPKPASTGQDVLATSITKYLDNNAKFENSKTARQLALQEEQLKLEQRKMDLLEKQHADRHGYGNSYGRPAPDQQHYDDYRYARPAPEQQQYDDRQGFHYGRPAPDQRQYDDRQGFHYGRPAPDQRQYDDYRYARPTPGQQQYDDGHGYGNSYGRSAPDQQQYHDHRYGRPAPDQEQYDDGHGQPPRERSAQELMDRRWCGYGSTYDRLAHNYQRDSNGRAVGHHTALQMQALGEIQARNGSYKENCEVMSMDGTVSKPASSTKYYSPVHQDDSYSSHYQSIPTNSAIDLTGDGNMNCMY